jgi:hypothetical protein
MSEKLPRVALVAVACLSLFATRAHAQQGRDGADWLGGSGNFTNAGQWQCSGPDFTPPSSCVPNGNQFNVLLSNGTVNIDTNVTVFSLGAGSNSSLSLNGTSLTLGQSGLAVTLASLKLTNGAAINDSTGSFGAVNLTMQNSTVNSALSVSGSGNVSGTANISGSIVQTLVVDGSFTISNGTLGDNSALLNSGQSIISGTSFNGQLALVQSGSVVMDNGSKINSVLFGTAVPVDVEAAGTPPTLTIQGGSQLNINGSNLVLGGAQNTSGTVFLSETSSITANNEQIGIFGTGTFTQTGGTNTISGQLTLGSKAGSGRNGLLSVDNTYTLSGGNLSSANVVVGDAGSGTFNQIGGKSTVTGQLSVGNQGSSVGNQAGGSGEYDLRATASLEAGTEIFGSGGSTYNQTGGTNTVRGDLTTAQNSHGSYKLSGNNAQLKVGGDENLGVEDGSRIEFVQSGGNNEIVGNLNLGGTSPQVSSARSGRGFYELDGGLVSVGGSEVIAPNGHNDFMQTGGLNTANRLVLQGTYELNGSGVLATTDEMIGMPLLLGGTTTFTQGGGTHTIAGTLTLGDRGNYILTYGTLTASEIINTCSGLCSSLLFNQSGGAFYYEGGDLNGNFDNEADATFYISGRGTRVVNGSLTNSGTVQVTANRVVFSNVTLTSGVFKADPTAVEFQNLSVGAAGVIIGAVGDVFSITGNFQNLSTQNTLWDTSSSVLDFTGGGTHIFHLAGQNGAGFSNNFAWGSLVLDPGNTLDLALGSGDALYAFMLQGLIISGNTITNIDGTPGLFVYYDAADNPSLNGNYNLTGGGELIAANGPAVTPEPTTLLLMTSGLGSLLTRLKWRGNRKPGA